VADGVIFDMDGVLVDSGPAHAASWRAVAEKHRIEISDEQFKRTFGRPSRDIIRIIWGEGVSDEDIRRYDEEKEASYRELVTGSVPLAAGAQEMLTALRQSGYVLAVATSGPRENVELVLRETGLGCFFVATVTGFDVKSGKPAPDCFLLAAHRAGLEPERCVVVEDAPVGIEAALAAGMKPIGFAGTHPARRLLETGAAKVVQRLAEITPNMVAELLEA
jgi:beta-phosphoglucomutase